MGSIIDTKRTGGILRCNKVKKAIVYITLIGTPISLIFLFFGIIRILFAKKKRSFLTNLILIIFISETFNSLSKIIQLLKYIFEDERDNRNIDGNDNARGIICQIQIVMSIYSDLCTLLASLFISLRCYDVIKYRKNIFDKGKKTCLSIILIMIFPIIVSISFLFIDRRFSDNSYRYDVRDRCSYWCWLCQLISIICFGFYSIFLILNIVFACKTYYYLKLGYKRLLKENDVTISTNSMSTPLNDISKDNSSKNSSRDLQSDKKNTNLTKEEKKRLEELRLMRVKCLIYPLVTIILWVFATIYRIADIAILKQFDTGGDTNIDEEKEFFEDHRFLQFVVQFFLVVHTILSSIRGIFYGFSFMVFEEKIFNNFFRNCMKKYFKNDELKLDEEPDEGEEKKIIRITENSSSIGESNEPKNNSGNENQTNQDKCESIEMDNSDYYYNE